MTTCGCIWWGNQHGYGIRMCEKHSEQLGLMSETFGLSAEEMLDRVLRRFTEGLGLEDAEVTS